MRLTDNEIVKLAFSHDLGKFSLEIMYVARVKPHVR